MDREPASEGRSIEPAASPRPPASPPVGSFRSIEPEHLYKAVGLFFLFLVFYNYFAEIARVLLLVYAAAIVAIAFNVLVGLVPRHRMLVTAGLSLVIFGGIAAILWLAVPALAGQLRGLAAEIPRLEAEIERFGEWLSTHLGINIAVFGEQARTFASEFFGGAEVLGRARGLVEGIFLPLVIIVGALYAVARPNARLLSPMLSAVPRHQRDAFRELLALLGTRIKGWVKGTLLAMLAVGTLTALGLWLLGVPYALLLGVIAGLLEIIPIVGPWVGGVIAVGIALLHDPTSAIWVALLMLGIQQLESNLITPMVMSKAAQVHPFVTLFALFFFGSIFGFAGVILALPLVLLVWTVIEVLWVGRAIGSEGDYIEPLVKEK